MSALFAPGEVHWFENDSEEEFSFLEFWAPPPTDTVWTVAETATVGAHSLSASFCWSQAGRPGRDSSGG